jgi:hypothetical protein
MAGRTAPDKSAPMHSAAGVSPDVAPEVAAYAHEISEDVRQTVLAVLSSGAIPSGALPDMAAALKSALRDIAAAETQLRAFGTSVLARRIGPVYTVEDLNRWLRGPGAGALSDEAIRKRARARQLVAFLTDDDRWAFPAWQFDRAGGQLVVRDDVTTLWKRLPSDGFLTGVDLAAWMATRLADLDGDTPAEYAHQHGVDSDPLVHAVSRLHARAA